VVTTTLKDFEQPLDSDSNNTYVVVIRALDSSSLLTAQTLTVTVTNVNEIAEIGMPFISGPIRKGSAISISVALNTPGRLRFFANGKRIPNCLARATVGSYPSVTGTCSWKPAVTGLNTISVEIIPTDASFSSITSSRLQVWVSKRSGTR
jgi:hypothetical protein